MPEVRLKTQNGSQHGTAAALKHAFAVSNVTNKILEYCGEDLDGIQSCISLALVGVLGTPQNVKALLQQRWARLAKPGELPPLTTIHADEITLEVLKQACREAGVRTNGTRNQMLQRLAPLSVPPAALARIRGEIRSKKAANILEDMRQVAENAAAWDDKAVPISHAQARQKWYLTDKDLAMLPSAPVCPFNTPAPMYQQHSVEALAYAKHGGPEGLKRLKQHAEAHRSAMDHRKFQKVPEAGEEICEVDRKLLEKAQQKEVSQAIEAAKEIIIEAAASLPASPKVLGYGPALVTAYRREDIDPKVRSQLVAAAKRLMRKVTGDWTAHFGPPALEIGFWCSHPSCVTSRRMFLKKASVVQHWKTCHRGGEPQWRRQHEMPTPPLLGVAPPPPPPPKPYELVHPEGLLVFIQGSPETDPIYICDVWARLAPQQRAVYTQPHAYHLGLVAPPPPPPPPPPPRAPQPAPPAPPAPAVTPVLIPLAHGPDRFAIPF